MDDHYDLADLRQLVSGGSTHLRHLAFPQALSLHFPVHRNVAQSGEDSQSQYGRLTMAGHQFIRDTLPELSSECGAVPAATTHTGSAGAGATSLSTGFEVETACDGGRWRRQETLILLEIRSKLHHKFREANQKGPLWDEISRIMSVEHGYQRSGRKCREKFENLYKYYKKTRNGKIGRQNGKHYRFFRQLDALYGETKNDESLHNNGVSRDQKSNQETLCLNLSDCSEFNSIASDENGVFAEKLTDSDVSRVNERKRRGGRSWGEKIKECIDSQMRKMMVKQEVWLEKLMKTLEQQEKDRMAREEEWRKQEVRRIERQHRIWADERECSEARDAALMATLQKLTRRQPENSSPMAGEGANNVDISKRGRGESSRREANEGYSASSSINGVQNGCFEFLMNDGEAWWENHGLKLN